jgi:hypothetical protein
MAAFFISTQKFKEVIFYGIFYKRSRHPANARNRFGGGFGRVGRYQFT